MKYFGQNVRYLQESVEATPYKEKRLPVLGAAVFFDYSLKINVTFSQFW